MHKIPVGRTIAFAYRFLFAHIGVVVGIGWLPAIVVAAATYGTRYYQMIHRAEIEAADPRAMQIAAAVSAGAVLVTLFASAVAAVGITREALGLRSGGALIYFSAGRTEWRMFAANIRYLLGAVALIALAMLIAVVAFALAGARLDAPDQIRLTAATILAALIAWFVFIYALVTIVRMSFLLPAVVVAEAKSGLKRAHDLTHGNFWRMVIVLIALSLPIALLLMAGFTAVLRAALGPDLGRYTPDDLVARIGPATDAILLPWSIFMAVVFVLGWGLIYSGAAYAYRALAPENPERR